MNYARSQMCCDSFVEWDRIYWKKWTVVCPIKWLWVSEELPTAMTVQQIVDDMRNGGLIKVDSANSVKGENVLFGSKYRDVKFRCCNKDSSKIMAHWKWFVLGRGLTNNFAIAALAKNNLASTSLGSDLRSGIIHIRGKFYQCFEIS